MIPGFFRSALVVGAAALTLAAGCGASSPQPSPAPAAAATPARSVLMISIDGLRDDYIRDASHAIPTLRGLAREGAVAHSLLSVWPSVTYPAHATLVTGVSPAAHGIVNNVVFDPHEKNDGGWYWYARDLRVETLWDVATKNRIEVANVTWPITVGASGIRWNLPQFWRAKNVEDEKLLCELSTPHLCEELRAAGLAVPGEHRSDRERMGAAAYLLRTKHPGLTLLYTADLDTIEHEKGPGSAEAWAMLEKIDQNLAYVLDQARASSPRLTIVLVSDHGFVPVERDVRPNVALRRAGLLESTSEGKDSKVIRYRAVTWKAGGTAAIMGDRAAKAEVLALFGDLAKRPEESGIARVLDGDELTARYGAFPGALVILQASEGSTFSERSDEPMVAPSKYRGMHGHDPTHPGMASTLILAGDGIRRGVALGDVAMIDVAPTVAELLGFTLPHAAGKPLRAALSP